MTSDRFQRPSTAAGARAATATDLPPHPPDVRDEEVDALLAADFPVALRGYDRTSVDAYVQRATRVIAELRASSSPQAAVRYALEQVSEETRAILQQAHDTAEKMTSKAQAEAAQVLEAAHREAAQLRTAAEHDAADLRAAADRRVREAEDDVVAIWQERERLVEDARDVAARLAEVADEAAARELPSTVELAEADTRSLPSPPVWEDADDDGLTPPPPMLHAVPPPPLEAAPEPELADAPPPDVDPDPAEDTVEHEVERPDRPG